MQSNQLQLIINCIYSLSESEKQLVFNEIEKIKPCVHKKIKRSNKRNNDVQLMANTILSKHHYKNTRE